MKFLFLFILWFPWNQSLATPTLKVPAVGGQLIGEREKPKGQVGEDQASLDLAVIEESYQEFRSKTLKSREKLEELLTEPTLAEARSRDFYAPINEKWGELVQGLLLTMKTSYRDMFPVDHLRRTTKDLTVLSKIRKWEHQLAVDWQEQVHFQFAVLKRVSLLRKEAMAAARERGESPLKFHGSLLRHILLEFKLIPYKIRVNAEIRMLEFREMTSGSFKGIMTLAKEVIFLFLLCLLPLFSKKASVRLVQMINRQKKRSFYLSFQSQFHRSLTFFLSKILPFTKYFIGLLTLNIAYWILRDSSVREVAELIIFIRFYLYYRIFRLSIEALLETFVAKNPMGQTANLKNKIDRTSFSLGLVFFIVVCVKESLRSILGESLIFVLLEPLFFWLLLSLFVFLAWEWRKEISSYLSSHFDVPWVKKLAASNEGWLAALICLPASCFICIHVVTQFFLGWVTRFDFAKKLSARWLRVRIEGMEAKNSSSDRLSQDYVQQFRKARAEVKENTIYANESFLQQLTGAVQKWADEKSEERTMAVYGPRGAGKSTVLLQLEKHFANQGLETLRLSSAYRVHTKPKMEKLLEDCFGSSTESSDEGLQTTEEKIPSKKIVFVDDAQLFFLSTIGGFEAFRYFLNFMNNRRPDLFWVVSFNEPSWVYLNSVLGDNQYFRYQFSIPIWSEDKIFELVSETHKQTQYRLNYDDVFKTTAPNMENSEMQPAEQRYFRLLWEQSHGIPGAAISLWLKSLREGYGKSLTVCLPSENRMGKFNSLNKDMFFVYAAFVKHDSLRIREAILATNLPEGLVRQAFLRGIEEGFLEKHEEFYRISMLWFSDIVRSLRGKNLIYGITG